MIERDDEWLARTTTKPMLLLTFGDTGLSEPKIVEWARSTLRSLELVPLGRAGHHAPEDAPDELARAIRSWLDRHTL